MNRKTLSIAAQDGVCPATLMEPDSKTAAAVMLYMDAFGPRAALFLMAEKLVREGYAVLVPDLMYRCEDRSPFEAKTTFGDPVRGPLLKSMLAATTQAMTIADTGAFLHALAAEGYTGPVGVTGYCMGGARALNAAAHYPDQIAAAASFHGGNLASDLPDSPHRHVGKIRGRVYVGTAETDASFPAAQAGLLTEALRQGGVDFILENYPGTEHGWCMPDSRVHSPSGAERHWTRLLSFFAETLKG